LGVADIGSIPRNENELKKWSFCHQLAHRDINRLIYQRLGITLPEYILDPIDPNNTDVWQYQHQLMHSNMDAVLGIAGNDLLGVDWKNEGLLEAWLFIHLPEHIQAAAALGL
jgi:hypothetical protein